MASSAAFSSSAHHRLLPSAAVAHGAASCQFCGAIGVSHSHCPCCSRCPFASLACRVQQLVAESPGIYGFTTFSLGCSALAALLKWRGFSRRNALEITRFVSSASLCALGVAVLRSPQNWHMAIRHAAEGATHLTNFTIAGFLGMAIFEMEETLALTNAGWSVFFHHGFFGAVCLPLLYSQKFHPWCATAPVGEIIVLTTIATSFVRRYVSLRAGNRVRALAFVSLAVRFWLDRFWLRSWSQLHPGKNWRERLENAAILVVWAAITALDCLWLKQLLKGFLMRARRRPTAVPAGLVVSIRV